MVNPPTFGGPWTQEKLEILRRYLDAYTTALKKRRFTLTYVDGFAGAGAYIEASQEYEDFQQVRAGSARIALSIDNRHFDRLLFIEREMKRVEDLRLLAKENLLREIQVVQGDANEEVQRFCRNMGPYDRAGVFLDPYATEVSWDTVAAIAETKKIDCWILFPLMAVTRIMPTGGEPSDPQKTRLDRVFGGREQWQGTYQEPIQPSLFGEALPKERESGSRQIADIYRNRLMSVFHQVAPTRRSFLNSKNSELFDLFFAAGNSRGAPIAIKIADYLLKNW